MNLVFASGVLVPQHILGFDYFRGVRDVFPGALFPEVPVTAGVKVRADAMAAQIDARFPTGPIHIVAHSMGGLDARSLLSRNVLGLGAPGRVASLSTISTPHRGSPIADLLVGPNPDGPGPRQSAYSILRQTLDSFGVPLEALGALTTGSTAVFNDTHPDVAHVRYLSYAGDRASIRLMPQHLYIDSIGVTDDERTNDGVVSVASAIWGEFIARWPTDHLGEVGHRDTLSALLTLQSSFDHIAAFRDVIARVT